VFTAGDTDTAVFDVTGPTLLSTLPFPLLNTAVKLVEVPAVMVAAAGTKLVMMGAATTITVADWVAVVPAALVTVNV